MDHGDGHRRETSLHTKRRQSWTSRETTTDTQIGHLNTTSRQPRRATDPHPKARTVEGEIPPPQKPHAPATQLLSTCSQATRRERASNDRGLRGFRSQATRATR